MANWSGGPLAVSAVPGAGKSTGLAVAAATAIARFRLHPQNQLVVVTFTRAAAANIRAKIRQQLRDLNIPATGFVVHTLHGLALYIANSHRELSGLDLNNSTLILPTPSNRITRTGVEQWINDNPKLYQQLIEGTVFDGEETERMRRQSVLRTEVLPELSWKVIQEAKSSGLTPEKLRQMAEQIPDDYQILEIAAGLYENYQRILQERSLIDYDEMILAALRVLKHKSIRQRWQGQIFAVFEDEAQDSTPLQNQLLDILARVPDSTATTPSPNLNLIRVGDPNQAINSTFTPADPIYFRQFCQDCEESGYLATMDQAGRSSQIILDAANFMVQWVNNAKPAGTEQPFRFQLIHPVGLQDPQPDANPVPAGRGLELYQPRNIYQTVELMAQRILQLQEQHPSGKFAILVRENKQAEFITNVLRNPQTYNLKISLSQSGLKLYDTSQSARHSKIPGELLALLQFIDRPHSPDHLKSALKTLGERTLIPPQDFNALATQPEQFLYPGPLDPPQSDSIRAGRAFCCNLLKARLELPPFQLISFLALALKYEQSELATADKLAERIARQTAGDNTLPGILTALSELVSSERFDPVEIDEDQPGESPFTRSGQLTIITMHKAKGLDWDYVFLPFLHEATIPGSLRVSASGRFLGDFTLSEVARAQIRNVLHQQTGSHDGSDSSLTVARAWEQAGNLKTAEEYRLLYVAMTRAKRLLWMSAARQAPYFWFKPDNLQDQKPCPVFLALKAHFFNHFIFVG
ncbi:MAG: ATP-dependent helicase [Oscillatoriales cyanobacterium RM2_1_1]|nr:ATP-dependent helicase [Oscillatoriales cyanobacterium RM2_1_1]